MLGNHVTELFGEDSCGTLYIANAESISGRHSEIMLPWDVAHHFYNLRLHGSHTLRKHGSYLGLLALQSDMWLGGKRKLNED